jgi:hypothetical protein
LPNEVKYFRLAKNWAGRFKLRAGTPPSRDCRILPAVTSHMPVTSHACQSTAAVLCGGVREPCANRWVASDKIYGLKASFSWTISVKMLWTINAFFMENKKSQGYFIT